MSWPKDPWFSLCALLIVSALAFYAVRAILGIARAERERDELRKSANRAPQAAIEEAHRRETL